MKSTTPAVASVEEEGDGAASSSVGTEEEREQEQDQEQEQEEGFVNLQRFPFLFHVALCVVCVHLSLSL
mgnify:CR=1 FL=1